MTIEEKEKLIPLLKHLNLRLDVRGRRLYVELSIDTGSQYRANREVILSDFVSLKDLQPED